MKLSVIILNYNVRYFLEQCVESVQKAIQNLDAEIIVVDNNSDDDSCEMMKRVFPSVHLIENKENSGFPKGNNIGVAAAKGDYICILNPDTVVAEDTFVKVMEFADWQSNLGIVGVKLIDGKGNFLPESKRGVPTPFVAFTKIAGLYKLSSFFGKYYAQHLSENQTGKVEILVGAFMFMKRETYLSVGGFDEDCFMYSDDIDLSYMILKTGKSNFYFHDTTVIHYKGESTARDKTYMNRFREAMNFFYKKHFHISWFFDIFMKSGAYLFALAKRNKKVMPKEIRQYALVSEDGGLKSALEQLTSRKVDLITHNEIADKSFVDYTEIVFDSETTDYKSVIRYMETFRKNPSTFKIAHKKSQFIIGSNSSNDRGEVINLADKR